MTTMGNRFGIQGLGAEAVHSIRDVDSARTSEVSRPAEDIELSKVICRPENHKSSEMREVAYSESALRHTVLKMMYEFVNL